MSFLICMVPVCPMRSIANHRSEQTSQLLFGEVVEILDAIDAFVFVRNVYDNYEGWCQRNQFAETSIAQSQSQIEYLSAKHMNEVTVNKQPMYIPLGCPVNFLHDETEFPVVGSIIYHGDIVNCRAHNEDKNFLRDIAMKYLNTAYQWGGRSVFGIDCSGFTQAVFRFINVPLLRDAYQQALQGSAIGFLEEVHCGDLAFFDNEEGKITHVGILLDQSTIIHSSGKVRVDAIDHQGILNADTGIRTHKLRLLKRMF